MSKAKQEQSLEMQQVGASFQWVSVRAILKHLLFNSFYTLSFLPENQDNVCCYSARGFEVWFVWFEILIKHEKGEVADYKNQEIKNIFVRH